MCERANSQLTKELEDNKVALGQAAQVIKEVPPVEVFDAKVKKLTEDNEKLQGVLKSLEQRASEAEYRTSADTVKLIDHLAEGDEALDEASLEMESFATVCLRRLGGAGIDDSC